jgi:hypothetical protein
MTDDKTKEESNKHDDDFFSVLKKSIAKNVYSDDQEIKSNEKKSLERSTIRIDSSDLISRCKNFLPLLTDANNKLFSKIQSGENVRIELDSDQDDNQEEKTIEMNLMFCPNVESSESDNDDDEQIKQKNQVNIIEIQDDNNTQEIINS